MTIQSINKWPAQEQPREKLLLHGAKYLSDAELIALFIRTGVRGKTALDIARSLLSQFGGLKKLLQIESTLLLTEAGIGKAKIALLKAAIELGKRYLASEVEQGEQLNDSQLTKRYLIHKLHDYPHEVFACLFLTNHYRVIAFEELFHGTINEASIYPREVVKRALAHNAAKLICAHNHPSGNPTPSDADIRMTDLLKQALALIEVEIVDHIVIGHQRAISLSEHGLL